MKHVMGRLDGELLGIHAEYDTIDCGKPKLLRTRLSLISRTNVKEDKLTRPKLSAKAVAALTRSIPDQGKGKDADVDRTPNVSFFTDICSGQNSVSMNKCSAMVGYAVNGEGEGTEVGRAKFGKAAERGLEG